MRKTQQAIDLVEGLTEDQKETAAALIEQRQSLVEAMLDATEQCVEWWRENIDDVDCSKCREGKIINLLIEMRNVIRDA